MYYRTNIKTLRKCSQNLRESYGKNNERRALVSFLGRNEITYSSSFVEIEDIAVAVGVYSAADCDGNTHCWKRNEKSRAIPSKIQLDAAQFQFIFNS